MLGFNKDINNHFPDYQSDSVQLLTEITFARVSTLKTNTFIKRKEQSSLKHMCHIGDVNVDLIWF